MKEETINEERGSENRRMFLDIDVNTGLIHRRQGLMCQDVVAYREDNSHITAVLCDGAGGLSRGREAAQIVSDCVAEVLHKKYNLYLHCKPEWIRQEIACEIEEKLTKEAKKCGEKSEEYACTVLAVSIGKDGNFICLHLGDGRVLMKGEENIFYTVSSPLNGKQRNETYLTMNCDIRDYLQVYQCHRRVEQILFWTDGMEEVICPNLKEVKHGEYVWGTGVNGKEIMTYTRELKKIPKDDYSVCLLSVGKSI